MSGQAAVHKHAGGWKPGRRAVYASRSWRCNGVEDLILACEILRDMCPQCAQYPSKVSSRSARAKDTVHFLEPRGVDPGYLWTKGF